MTDHSAAPDLVRADGRTPDALRDIVIERGWSAHAEGSALISFGQTKVLCTASFTNGVPRCMTGKGAGWVALTPDGKTAYVANPVTNDVSVVDVATMKETAKVKVGFVPKRNVAVMLQ